MPTRRSSLPPEALLEHGAFLRALSRSLLRDEHEAEDNVQQTWAIALERPPAHRRSVRGWLATVARRLALRRLRAAGRRARHERRAPPPGAPPGPPGVAEMLETQRRVVEAVAALEEPYRSAVARRYFQGKSPREIAREDGVPVETVKTRLRRAREQLRRRLDEAHDGDRRTWCLALALLFPPPGGGATGKAAAAAAIVGLAAAPWLLRPSADRPAPAVAVVREARAPAAATGGEGVLRAPAPPPGVVAGTVHAETGRARLARVRLRGPVERESFGDAFFFEGLPPGRYAIEARHEGFAPHRFSFDLAPDAGAGPFDVLLVSGGALLVRVAAPGDAPVPGEAVVLRPEDGGGPVLAETGADGAVLVEHLAPGPVRVERAGLDARVVTVRPGRTIEVVFRTGCAFSGTVVGPDGMPAAGAVVRLLPARPGAEGYRSVEARTGEAGDFAMRGFPPGDYDVMVQVLGARGCVAQVARILLRPGDDVLCPLRIGGDVLGGRITRADTGEPPDPGRVQVVATPVQPAEGRAVVAFADAEGRYAFAGLLPGVHEIRVASHDPAVADARRLVDFTAGGRLDGVDFALEPRLLGRLRLTVVEPDGTPATGLSFWLSTGPRTSRTVHPTQVDDGVFDLWLEPGERRVSVVREGFRTDPVEVRVAEGGTVTREVQLRQAMR